ncbi:MAG: phage tail tape measure protein, partial [Burkholderiales bacterium]
MRAAVIAEEEFAAATTGAAKALATEQRQLALRRATSIADVLNAEAEARKRLQAATVASNKALREQSSAQTSASRSQAQLRRGGLATSLSFLGIRGATLAASASFLAGAAAITIFAKALQSASKFTDALNVFRATTAATRQELEQVAAAARALGADITLPGVTAADAAESMVELAKAGLGVQDSIDGARGVLQLATAAAIENAQAVELAANALNAFELQGRDATRVADVFANAANAAQGSIVDIGIAFQQAAAAGRQVGLSFEDTSAFLTVLAQNGLKGSDAGTSLRTALIRLIRPTDEARARLKELGVEIRDVNGNLRPDIFIQLA